MLVNGGCNNFPISLLLFILCNIEFLLKKFQFDKLMLNPILIYFLRSLIYVTFSQCLPTMSRRPMTDDLRRGGGGYVRGFTTYLACFDPTGIVSCLSQCLKIERVFLQYKMLACRKISISS